MIISKKMSAAPNPFVSVVCYQLFLDLKMACEGSE